MNIQSAPHVASSTPSASLDALLAGGTASFDVASQRVLRALFELARSDRAAHAGAIARLLGLRASAVGQHLLRLDAMGLVQANRARLTLAGLATAVRLPALAEPAEASAPRVVGAFVSAADSRAQPGAPSARAARPAQRRPHVPSALRPAHRRTIRTSPSSVSL